MLITSKKSEINKLMKKTVLICFCTSLSAPLPKECEIIMLAPTAIPELIVENAMQIPK